MRASRPDLRHGSRASFAGVVATGLLLGAAATVALRSAGELMEPGDAYAAGKNAAAPAAKVAPAKTAPAKPAAKPATSAAAAVPGVQITPVRPANPAPAAPVAHLEDQLTYQYNALGRRDPFQPMIGGEFVGEDVGGNAPVDVGGMEVVGIVWGADDKFALVEDARGNSLVLRAGDKVMNGVVESLRRDAVVVRLTMDGQSQSVAIPLMRKGDRSNGQR